MKQIEISEIMSMSFCAYSKSCPHNIILSILNKMISNYETS